MPYTKWITVVECFLAINVIALSFELVPSTGTDPPPLKSLEQVVYEERLNRACPNGLSQCPDISNYIRKCSKTNGQKLGFVDTTPFLTRAEDLCRGKLFLVAVVHSSPGNFQRRETIRKTWGSLRQVGSHRIQIAFFLGRLLNSDNLTETNVKEESDKYGDIVQRDYIENYRNMTRKHLTVIQWISENCSNAQYAMKVDDDTFVDIFHVVQFLLANPLNHSFYCTATVNARPQRKPIGHLKKWTVTRREYQPSKYPVYCEGLAYLMDAKLAKGLHWCSIYTKFFWIDDVYVTGILAQKLQYPRIKFWKGHSYANMLPSHASISIVDYIFLMAANNEFMPTVWSRLWRAVLTYSMELT